MKRAPDEIEVETRRREERERTIGGILTAMKREHGAVAQTTKGAVRSEAVMGTVERLLAAAKPGSSDYRARFFAIARWLYGVESAIEAQLALALYELVSLGDPAYARLVEEAEGRYKERFLPATARFGGLGKQVDVDTERGRCEVDFGLEVTLRVRYPNGNSFEFGACVPIECDGFSSHSRPEQVERDDARTRALLLAGCEPPLRFTGSEIRRDARACAIDAVRYAFACLPGPDFVEGVIAQSTLVSIIEAPEY